MIQNKPYEFMVKFTPQREWIENKGLLMWLSTFFVEVGAATFLVSSVFGSLRAMFAGIFLCAVLGGGLHLADLGRPLRFWRMLFSPGWKTSWIARGIWFVNLFIVFGGMYLVFSIMSLNVPGMLIASNVFAFLTIIYFGFLLSYFSGLALWNSALLPILILVLSIWGGLDVFMLTVLITGNKSVAAEFWSRMFPLIVIFIITCYLAGLRHQGPGGKVSFREIARGKWAPLFWLGVVLVGLIVPMGAGLIHRSLFDLSDTVLGVFLLFELSANLSFRYCLLKCAVYEPIVPNAKGAP